MQFCGSDPPDDTCPALKTHLLLELGDGEAAEEMSDQKPADQGVHGRMSRRLRPDCKCPFLLLLSYI